MKFWNLFPALILICSISIVPAQPLPDHVPAAGLIGWWPFNGNAQDEGGGQHHGTVQGAALAPDRHGNTGSAYEFNGNGSHISIPAIPSLNTDPSFTFSLWTRIDGWNSNTDCNMGCSQQLINRGTENTDNYFRMAYNPGDHQFKSSMGTHTSGFFLTSTTADPLPQENWHHVVTTYDGVAFHMYVNGQLEASYFGETQLAASNDPILFGMNTIAGYYYYVNGLMDDIGIWDRALEPCEIAGLYQDAPLSFLSGPTDQTVMVNEEVEFHAVHVLTSALYQWQSDDGGGFEDLADGGQYSGTTTGMLSIANVTQANDDHLFRCIISFGTCTDTSSVASLTVNDNVGLNEHGKADSFTLFPNPASDRISVKLKGATGAVAYHIIDNAGRIVLSGAFTLAAGTVDLFGLENGTYFIRVGDGAHGPFVILRE